MIILRTFGSDLPEVIEELNNFYEGKHINYDYVRYDGSENTTDRRIKSEGVGKFYRN